MVIIGQKKVKPKKNKYYKFACPNCGCVYLANDDEIYVKTSYDNIWREVRCPKCSMVYVFNTLIFRRYRRKVKNEIPKS